VRFQSVLTKLVCKFTLKVSIRGSFGFLDQCNGKYVMSGWLLFGSGDVISHTAAAAAVWFR
jgi:hypothetical protein